MRPASFANRPGVIVRATAIKEYAKIKTDGSNPREVRKALESLKLVSMREERTIIMGTEQKGLAAERAELEARAAQIRAERADAARVAQEMQDWQQATFDAADPSGQTTTPAAGGGGGGYIRRSRWDQPDTAPRRESLVGTGTSQSTGSQTAGSGSQGDARGRNSLGDLRPLSNFGRDWVSALASVNANLKTIDITERQQRVDAGKVIDRIEQMFGGPITTTIATTTLANQESTLPVMARAIISDIETTYAGSKADCLTEVEDEIAALGGATNKDQVKVLTNELRKLYTERGCYADADDKQINLPFAKRTLKSRIGAAADAPRGQPLPIIEDIHSLIDAWTATDGDAFALLAAIDKRLNEAQTRRLFGDDTKPQGAPSALLAEAAAMDPADLAVLLAAARRNDEGNGTLQAQHHGDSQGTMQMQRRLATGIAGRESRDESNRGGGQHRPGSRGVCYEFQRGECHRGSLCRFEHKSGTADTRDRSRSRDRARDRGYDRSRSRSREESQARLANSRRGGATNQTRERSGSPQQHTAAAAASGHRPGTPRQGVIEKR
jgi:hypothetical protein